MSHVVVEFEDDEKLEVVPTCWLKNDGVLLPTVKGRNLQSAIMQVWTPADTWEEYPARVVLGPGPYEIALDYAKKYSRNMDDSDTSPCRGVIRRRRPRPIRRYTPDPTDEESRSLLLSIPPPSLHSTVISPILGGTSAPVVNYPPMRPKSFSQGTDAELNISLIENVHTSKTNVRGNTAIEDVLAAIQSLREYLDNKLSAISRDIRDLTERMDSHDARFAALDEQMQKYHLDVLRNKGNSSPKQPRWRPWFPLRSITDVQAMELNLQNENCRSDVVAFIQRTPSGNMEERTKICLGRIVSNELSRNLSWQNTNNKMGFGQTTLWAVILETLAGTSSDPAGIAVGIRKTCITWFQNARDRAGGRSKKTATRRTMPLLERTDENISPEKDDVNMCTTHI